MRSVALIVAAGRGSRMQADMPKQYMLLGGHPVLWHTVQVFLGSDAIDRVCVVIHPEDQPLYDRAFGAMSDERLAPPVLGGASRAESVRLGLDALAADQPDYVLIHDGARPFCPPELISAVLEPLAQVEGAFAALPMVDALWRAKECEAQHPVSREGLWRAQTPQAFRYKAIHAAHTSGDTTAADDVATARAAGMRVRLVDGAEENFKITRPSDLTRAEQILAAR